MKASSKPRRSGWCGVFVAQVPLAEDGCGVAGGLQHLRQKRRLKRQSLAFQDRMRHAVAHGVSARHQRRARGRASWTDKKTRHPQARIMQLIQVGRHDPGMAMSPERSISLIVGHHQDNIGTRTGEFLRRDLEGESGDGHWPQGKQHEHEVGSADRHGDRLSLRRQLCLERTT